MTETAAGGTRDVLLAGESNFEKPDIADTNRQGFISRARKTQKINKLVIYAK